MPRVYRTQKEREKFLIREFVRQLGYMISNPVWQESPDALLTLRKGRERKRVAIEHTDHHNDTVAGQMSPLTPTAEFWLHVETRLMRRVSHRKQLTGLQVRIRFVGNPTFPCYKDPQHKELARKLAAEIVDFALSHPIAKGSGFHSFRKSDFRSHGTMNQFLSSLRLSRSTDEHVGASKDRWICDNVGTGPVTVSLEFIRSSIAAKNEKATTYNWGTATERWLLIACGGKHVNTDAPRFELVDINWNDPILVNLFRDSPFDRIFIWNRVHSQIKTLKP